MKPRKINATMDPLPSQRTGYAWRLFLQGPVSSAEKPVQFFSPLPFVAANRQGGMRRKTSPRVLEIQQDETRVDDGSMEPCGENPWDQRAGNQVIGYEESVCMFLCVFCFSIGL